MGIGQRGQAMNETSAGGEGWNIAGDTQMEILFIYFKVTGVFYAILHHYYQLK